MLTASLVGLVTKAIMVKVTIERAVLLVNLVKEFTVATSVKTLLLNIRIIIFNLRTAAFKAYCAICVRRFNFRHQASPRVSPRESTQRRKVELWARNVW
jgi:hypothetical protein